MVYCPSSQFYPEVGSCEIFNFSETIELKLNCSSYDLFSATSCGGCDLCLRKFNVEKALKNIASQLARAPEISI
jgi:hypothetical protein